MWQHTRGCRPVNMNRTTIDLERTENGLWKATQPDVNVTARGETAQLAVANYGEILHDVVHGADQQVSD